MDAPDAQRGQTLERDAHYTEAAASYRDAVRIAREVSNSSWRSTRWGLAYEEMGRFPDAERNSSTQLLAMLEETERK